MRATPEMLDQLSGVMTIRQVAETYNRNRDYVRFCVETGLIVAAKTTPEGQNGGVWLIPRAAAEMYFKKG